MRVLVVQLALWMDIALMLAIFCDLLLRFINGNGEVYYSLRSQFNLADENENFQKTLILTVCFSLIDCFFVTVDTAVSVFAQKVTILFLHL
ncbi:hypothetical protein T07_12384 [Trichinella nelsoni]|uniref:Uncharacterized protein n=1 Tax=Trichinella nelsoni TaxID=6336 RepID=A0A0V0RSU1_9BILA|nr:hypothetical protein T07_12384 [Trichinella nelsoni]